MLLSVVVLLLGPSVSVCPRGGSKAAVAPAGGRPFRPPLFGAHFPSTPSAAPPCPPSCSKSGKWLGRSPVFAPRR
eukprot:6892507-Pyramimonas_sp.AAC.1